MRKIKLMKLEVTKLRKLSRVAQNTPCFAITSEQALSGRDFASMAIKDVYNYWKLLSKKYKFSLSRFSSINEKTCVLELS